MDEALTALLDGRVAGLNDRPAVEAAPFVLLWLQGQRRLEGNLAAAHAQRRANELRKPLVVYEGLRRDYPHASERLHRFVLDGVARTARDCEERGLAYAFFLDEPGAPRGVLHALAARAALVVTDWLPTFLHPAQSKALAARAPCRVEAVDAAGVAPLSAFPRAEIGARTLRPKLQRLLPERLRPIPPVPPRVAPPVRFDWGFEPFRGTPDEGVRRAGVSRAVSAAPLRGGREAGLARLAEFVRTRLTGYAALRNDPSTEHTSGLSPYLHFGFVGAVEAALAASGSGAPREDVDAFLEELLVRRELALNFCARVPAHASIEALPGWARATLEAHEGDPRALLPDEELEAARSPDPLWNAAQRQLVREGRIHGYLRMLWGKSLLHWSRGAGEALRRMTLFNDRYALDGRDASSATNFLWCLGLHDRPFPERPIFGKVRSMTSASTARKFSLSSYLARFGQGDRRS